MLLLLIIHMTVFFFFFFSVTALLVDFKDSGLRSASCRHCQSQHSQIRVTVFHKRSSACTAKWHHVFIDGINRRNKTSERHTACIIHESRKPDQTGSQKSELCWRKSVPRRCTCFPVVAWCFRSGWKLNVDRRPSMSALLVSGHDNSK